MLAHVINVFERWPEFAEKAGVAEDRMRQIQSVLRLSFPA